MCDCCDFFSHFDWVLRLFSDFINFELNPFITSMLLNKPEHYTETCRLIRTQSLPTKTLDQKLKASGENWPTTFLDSRLIPINASYLWGVNSSANFTNSDSDRYTEWLRGWRSDNMILRNMLIWNSMMILGCVGRFPNVRRLVNVSGWANSDSWLWMIGRQPHAKWLKMFK